ncbi:hypothetical protein MRX96_034532 [Rhipicephalus microplus]
MSTWKKNWFFVKPSTWLPSRACLFSSPWGFMMSQVCACCWVPTWHHWWPGICSRLESREQYGMKPSRSFVAACSPLRSDNGKLSGCVMRFMCLSSQQVRG